MPIPEPKLWFPDSPHLYDVDVWIVDKKSAEASSAKDPAGAMDHVKSYTAMRKSALGKDRNGSLRLMLNDVFIFQVRPSKSFPVPDCRASSFRNAACRACMSFLEPGLAGTLWGSWIDGKAHTSWLCVADLCLTSLWPCEFLWQAKVRVPV